MTLSRTNSATATYSPPRRGADASRDRGDSGSPRPEIWVEGRQAPPFNPMTYATAGMLLSRAASANGLLGFSGRAAAVSDFFARRDWTRFAERLGRVGRWLPSAEGTARTFAALSDCAGVAQRLLYALPDPANSDETATGTLPPDSLAAKLMAGHPQPAEAGSPATSSSRPDVPLSRPGEREPVIRNRRDLPATPPGRPEDPDLTAIRALIAEESRPAEPKKPRRKPRRERKPATPRTGTPGITRSLRSRIGRWTTVRLLAGGGFALAAPFGFGKALWRHLDGTDLRELVAEYRQTPGK